MDLLPSARRGRRGGPDDDRLRHQRRRDRVGLAGDGACATAWAVGLAWCPRQHGAPGRASRLRRPRHQGRELVRATVRRPRGRRGGSPDERRRDSPPDGCRCRHDGRASRIDGHIVAVASSRPGRSRSGVRRAPEPRGPLRAVVSRLRRRPPRQRPRRCDSRPRRGAPRAAAASSPRRVRPRRSTRCRCRRDPRP